MKQTGAVFNKICMLSISSYKCLHRSLCSLEKRSFRVIHRLSASTLVPQIKFRRSRHFRNWISLTPVSTCHRKTLCYQIPRPPMIIQKTENQFLFSNTAFHFYFLSALRGIHSNLLWTGSEFYSGIWFTNTLRYLGSIFMKFQQPENSGC